MYPYPAESCCNVGKKQPRELAQVELVANTIRNEYLSSNCTWCERHILCKIINNKCGRKNRQSHIVRRRADVSRTHNRNQKVNSDFLLGPWMKVFTYYA